jgi:hypothetical protein
MLNVKSKKLILLVIVLVRVLVNDGIFTSQRKLPNRPQPPEIRVAIRRPWRKGVKNANPRSS